jgi:hypothetical protein
MDLRSRQELSTKIGYVDSGIRPNLRPDPRGQVVGIFLDFRSTRIDRMSLHAKMKSVWNNETKPKS